MADSTAYLYYMQNMDNHTQGGWGFRRDLVRVPVTLRKSDTTSTSIDQGASPTQAIELTIHPNPTHDYARISWIASTHGQVRVEIISTLGTTTTLVDAFLSPGSHTLDYSSTSLAAGTYLVRISAGAAGTKTMPLVVVR